MTIKTVVSVSQGIYNTENSTDQLEIRVSKKEKTLYSRRKSPFLGHSFEPFVAHALYEKTGF